MSDVLIATALALGSALLHVVWNVVVKVGDDHLLAGWGVTTIGAALFAPSLVVLGPPDARVIPFVVASSVTHVLYSLSLVKAYEHGDLSAVYPLARGVAPLLTAVGASAVLGDALTPVGYAGVTLVSAGLVGSSRKNLAAPEIGWAVMTGVTIAVYTLIDTAGVRSGHESLRYVIALFVGHTLLLSAVVAALRGPGAMARAIRATPVSCLVGGLGTVGAYALVLFAVRLAPVAYVAALRETSVILGALTGWLVLHEPFGASRSAASVIVAAGIALLIGAPAA